MPNYQVYDSCDNWVGNLTVAENESGDWKYTDVNGEEIASGTSHGFQDTPGLLAYHTLYGEPEEATSWLTVIQADGTWLTTDGTPPFISPATGPFKLVPTF